MIPVPAGVRVWLATGVTDMRKGMNGSVSARAKGGPPWREPVRRRRLGRETLDAVSAVRVGAN
jgi:hypothetical protein